MTPVFSWFGESFRMHMAALRVTGHQPPQASGSVPDSHFAFLIRGRHVLVRTDNHINRQGRVHSTALWKLAENLWSWALEHQLFLRTLHVPGLQDTGTDLVSRDDPLPDE